MREYFYYEKDQKDPNIMTLELPSSPQLPINISFFLIISSLKNIDRKNGPAIIVYENGRCSSEIWVENNKMHRNDGPAVINYIYINNIQTIHNIAFYRSGELHREDGPATEIFQGKESKKEKMWYLEGKKI